MHTQPKTGAVHHFHASFELCMLRKSPYQHILASIESLNIVPGTFGLCGKETLTKSDPAHIPRWAKKMWIACYVS